MNLPLGFCSEWGAETATRTLSVEKGSNASWICGRQQRRNRAARCPRPRAQSYMYATLKGRIHVLIVRQPVRELASRRPLCNLGSHGARRRAASECRRQVRPAAPRRARRARGDGGDAQHPESTPSTGEHLYASATCGRCARACVSEWVRKSVRTPPPPPQRACACACSVHGHGHGHGHAHGGVSIRARVRLRRLRLPRWAGARTEDRLGLHYMDTWTWTGTRLQACTTLCGCRVGAAMVAGYGCRPWRSWR